MLRQLRNKLTIWVLGVYLLIYGVGGALALLVFENGLAVSMDEEIEALQSEIIPSISLASGPPSLREYALTAKKENLKFPATMQIYDSSGHLLESYGPQGIERLARGPLKQELAKHSISVRSAYSELNFQGSRRGYLQVQLSTAHKDSAVQQFGATMLLLFPILALVVGVSGFLFATKAMEPVAKMIKILQRFVVDAGHEFNTPISVIEASIQTLEEHLKENRQDVEILDIISRASARMKELSRDLVLLAKIDSPEYELPRELLLVEELILPAINEVAELARSKNIELSCSPLPHATLMANEHSLRVLLDNLLTNALKYTDDGGQVKVEVEVSADNVIVSVKDTGVGIPKESQEHIFDRFYRVDRSRSRAAGGSGLGLSIVKGIVDLHRGSIKVVSEPGRGSCFSVSLPTV